MDSKSNERARAPNFVEFLDELKTVRALVERIEPTEISSAVPLPEEL